MPGLAHPVQLPRPELGADAAPSLARPRQQDPPLGAYIPGPVNMQLLFWGCCSLLAETFGIGRKEGITLGGSGKLWFPFRLGECECRRFPSLTELVRVYIWWCASGLRRGGERLWMLTHE